MNLQLAGRRAPVMGSSSSSVGAEIARMRATEGVKVIVHGRDLRRTRAVAAEIGAA